MRLTAIVSDCTESNITLRGRHVFVGDYDVRLGASLRAQRSKLWEQARKREEIRLQKHREAYIAALATGFQP